MDYNIWKTIKYSVESKKWILKLKINETIFNTYYDTLEQAAIHSHIFENNYLIEGIYDV